MPTSKARSSKAPPPTTIRISSGDAVRTSKKLSQMLRYDTTLPKIQDFVKIDDVLCNFKDWGDDAYEHVLAVARTSETWDGERSFQLAWNIDGRDSGVWISAIAPTKVRQKHARQESAKQRENRRNQQQV